MEPVHEPLAVAELRKALRHGARAAQLLTYSDDLIDMLCPATQAGPRSPLSVRAMKAEDIIRRGVAEIGGELTTITYRRAWDKARTTALSPAEYASPLARRVYDLRHACVSTWLNGGVPPAQVAEWAGHSVSVLLKVYAKCIEGQDETAKRRIEAALRAGN